MAETAEQRRDDRILEALKPMLFEAFSAGMKYNWTYEHYGEDKFAAEFENWLTEWKKTNVHSG